MYYNTKVIDTKYCLQCVSLDIEQIDLFVHMLYHHDDKRSMLM